MDEIKAAVFKTAIATTGTTATSQRQQRKIIS